MTKKRIDIPEWIRGRLALGDDLARARKAVEARGLNSICVSAACPNRGECWQKKHVTFMILGDRCTRGCRFCNVENSSPLPPDPEEPFKVTEAVEELGAEYIVLTSVTRDDLPDGGCGQFVRTVNEIKKRLPHVKVELLIPDFKADPEILSEIVSCGADVIGHNIEMPEALYKALRPEADYARSLEVLRLLKDLAPDLPRKSSVMVGLGEGEEDLVRTFRDLAVSGVDILYIGQYLSPTASHYPVKRYYTPRRFEELKELALGMGFPVVCSAPMQRQELQISISKQKILFLLKNMHGIKASKAQWNIFTQQKSSSKK